MLCSCEKNKSLAAQKTLNKFPCTVMARQRVLKRSQSPLHSTGMSHTSLAAFLLCRIYNIFGLAVHFNNLRANFISKFSGVRYSAGVTVRGERK